MKTNILYISVNFNYSCGVSKHVYINLKQISENPKYKLFFITNEGDSLERLLSIPKLSLSIFSFKKDDRNILKLIIFFFKLYLFCSKNKIDIIHTHHRYPELLAVLVSKFIRIKTITTCHSFVKGLKDISFRSNKIITVSKAVEEHLHKNFAHTKGNSTTIYNCIDESFYEQSSVNSVELNKSLGFNASDKIIIFAGRISKIKGSDILIEAFKKLPNELSAKLLLIGSITDDHLNYLVKMQDKNIKIISPQKDIKPYYQIADVVVLPSREDPFPFVMLEAGAMHKPFLGSKTSGISEFIDDGINGFLFESENVDELTSKIIYLFSNPEISFAAGEKLYNKVKDICNCEKYFEVLDKIYIDLLS